MDAAVEFLRAGGHPSVDAVAARARVSRATAYRYFPSQDLMLSEARVRAGASADSDVAPVDHSTPADPAGWAAVITRRAGRFSLEHEERLRTALRLSLDPQSGYRRPGRRGQWVDHMLAPAGDR